MASSLTPVWNRRCMTPWPSLRKVGMRDARDNGSYCCTSCMCTVNDVRMSDWGRVFDVMLLAQWNVNVLSSAQVSFVSLLMFVLFK